MKRLVVVVAAAFILTNAAAADPSLPPAAGSPSANARKGPTPADYLERADDKDPRRLRPTSKLKARGFDAGYVSAFSRPHVELDAQSQAKPPVVLHAPSPDEVAINRAANPYLALQGRVIVVQGRADEFNGSNLDQQNGLFSVAQDVLGQFGDFFDFITVFEPLASNGEAAAFYAPLKNDIQGLGDCLPNSFETFGCEFDNLQGSGINKLQGVIYMNSLGFWQQWDSFVDETIHPFDDFDQNVYAVLGQETAHRWGAALRFKDPRNGGISKRLLGRDSCHWASFVDTDASVMDGWDWSKPSGGRFTLVGDMDRFSTLDLYTMGALPVASAQPFFFIDGAKYDVEGDSGFANQVRGQIQGSGVGAQDALQFPSVDLLSSNDVDVGATGTEVDLTIQDVVNAEGNRCPDPDHTQRTFRQAFVYVVRPGTTASQTDINNLNTVAELWDVWWADRTNRALTVCTDPNGECKQALANLGGGTVQVEGDADFIERGQTATVVMTAGADATVAEPSGDNPAGKLKNAIVHLTLDGGGAKHASLQKSEINAGDVDAGADVDVPVKIDIDDQYECNSSLIVAAEISSDNAPNVREEYRLFPGFSNIFVENFGSSDDFKVNADGKDNTKKGALERADVALNCDITPRTPEKDNTPGSTGAYITGAHEELDGDTSLWSPEIDLRDTADPELAYDFWFEGDGNDSLLVELSEDGEKFKTATEETESAHGWGLERVNIKDVFGHIPKKVTARFIFNGHGHLEGGIDNVRVLDPSGQCRSQAVGFCGCSTDGSAAPQGALAFAVGLLGLRLATRRRRSP